MSGAASAKPAAGLRAAAFDGVPAASLASQLAVPALHLFASVESTMDVAHALAGDGAAAGTTVLADAQVAGRGRHGRHWHSAAGQGIWATVVERPHDAAAVDVLSLRIGLAIAEALQPLADSPVQLKWPNDLLVMGRKLGGVLVEARWRDARPEWVAIGVGVNVGPPAHAPGAGLRDGASRVDALVRTIAAVRAAARCTGPLAEAERVRYGARDAARGRSIVAPAPGIVTGIDATGALTVAGDAGVTSHRSGSLVFAEDA